MQAKISKYIGSENYGEELIFNFEENPSSASDAIAAGTPIYAMTPNGLVDISSLLSASNSSDDGEDTEGDGE